MYKEDLALDNLQCLIGYQTKPIQTKLNLTTLYMVYQCFDSKTYYQFINLFDPFFLKYSVFFKSITSLNHGVLYKC